MFSSVGIVPGAESIAGARDPLPNLGRLLLARLRRDLVGFRFGGRGRRIDFVVDALVAGQVAHRVCSGDHHFVLGRHWCLSILRDRISPFGCGLWAHHFRDFLNSNFIY